MISLNFQVTCLIVARLSSGLFTRNRKIIIWNQQNAQSFDCWNLEVTKELQVYRLNEIDFCSINSFRFPSISLAFRHFFLPVFLDWSQSAPHLAPVKKHFCHFNGNTLNLFWFDKNRRLEETYLNFSNRKDSEAKNALFGFGDKWR